MSEKPKNKKIKKVIKLENIKYYTCLLKLFAKTKYDLTNFILLELSSFQCNATLIKTLLESKIVISSFCY